MERARDQARAAARKWLLSPRELATVLAAGGVGLLTGQEAAGAIAAGAAGAVLVPLVVYAATLVTAPVHILRNEVVRLGDEVAKIDRQAVNSGAPSVANAVPQALAVSYELKIARDRLHDAANGVPLRALFPIDKFKSHTQALGTDPEMFAQVSEAYARLEHINDSDLHPTPTEVTEAIRHVREALIAIGIYVGVMP